MLAEPAEHGGQANHFLGLVPFGQIKDQRVAKRRKILRASRPWERTLTKSSAFL